MVYKVALDDGHGYETAGKRTPDGYRENYFNEAVVKKLAKLLKNDNRFSVYEVADGRGDVPLTTRTNRANSWGADVYVSVHYNAMGFSWSNHIGGIETFSYPGSSTGRKIASCLHKQLVKGTKLYDRGLKTANFHVLRETRMPAALVECGFMDVKREADLMKSDAYRQECANELYVGLCDYFNVSPKSVSAPAAPDNGLLGVGDKGKAVEELQRRLTALGYDTKGIDGDFGPNTNSALKAFQKDAKIDVDGIAGPQVYKALDKAEDKKKAEEKAKKEAEEARKKAEQSKKEEEDEMLQVAIVINTYNDYPAAELVAYKHKAPIYPRKAISGEVAKHVIVVGGNKDGLKADKITVLAGSDRIETVKAVEKYIK